MNEEQVLIWKIQQENKEEIKFFVSKKTYDTIISDKSIRLFDIPYNVTVTKNDEKEESYTIGKYVKQILELKSISKKTRVLYPNAERKEHTAYLINAFQNDIVSFIYGYGVNPDIATANMDTMNEIIFGNGKECYTPYYDNIEKEWKVDFPDRPSERGDILYVVSEYLYDGVFYRYNVNENQCHAHGFEGVLTSIIHEVKEGNTIDFNGFESDYSKQEIRLAQMLIQKLSEDIQKTKV